VRRCVGAWVRGTPSEGAPEKESDRAGRRAAPILPRPGCATHAALSNSNKYFNYFIKHSISLAGYLVLGLSSRPVCCLTHDSILNDPHHLIWIAHSRFSPGPLCHPDDIHLQRLGHHQDFLHLEIHTQSLQALSELEWHSTLALRLLGHFQQVRATRRHR